jgi:hypothetical protein
MSEPDAHDPVERFIASALIAVGALILGLSGLCTGALAVNVLTSVVRSANGFGGDPLAGVFGFVLMLGLFGGVPMLIGALLLRWGLRLLRPWRRETSPDRTRQGFGRGVFVLGVAITLATIGGAIWLIASTAPTMRRGGPDGGYVTLFLPVGGLIATVVGAVGLALLVEGFRLSRGPRPPPVPPPRP